MAAADPYRYFRIEAHDLARELGQGVVALERAGDAELVRRLLRLAHTLKGAARVVRLGEIAESAHAIEDLLAPFRDIDGPAPPDAIDRLLGLLDDVGTRLEAIGLPDGAPAPQAGTRTPDRPEPPTLRAAAGAVDDLVGGIAEAYRQVVALAPAGAGAARLRRLADALADRGASDAALTRTLASELRSAALALERSIATGLDRTERQLRSVREAAEQLRLLPVAAAFPLLERTARDAARTLGRTVSIRCTGGALRIDAEVARPLQDALVQLVRNAVAHGIEAPGEREHLGKPAEGSIHIAVSTRGRSIVVRCSDDGRGIDETRLRRAIEAHGRALPPGVDGADRLLHLLLAGGGSTSPEVTQIAGRGIGMDVVADAVARMGATISVSTALGQGTTFELVVPRTLALLDVLLVDSGVGPVAIPLAAVRFAYRLGDSAAATRAGAGTLPDGTSSVPFVPLSRLLGHAAGRREDAATAFMLETSAGPLAVGVRVVLGVTPLLVRALPALTPADTTIAGTALDAAGRPLLVLDADGLAAAAAGLAAETPGAAPVRRPLLVVDDSLTTRMLEQSILESAGYEVDLAVSGEDGLVRARAGAYGLILCDVEMPGMDGFAFVEALRRDPALRDTPAILVTSRDAPADKLRGEAVGAQGYIVKSAFDQADLLDRIDRLLA